MSEKAGSILGGILLTVGSCVGAGMLGLPIVTGLCGYYPSILMFLIAWGYMTTTALLLVEVNSWHESHVNILTMAHTCLGKTAKAICWVFYLFLFYSLLVAYISGSGNLLSTLSSQYTRYQIPPSIGALFFVLFFGWLIYLGTRKVDLCNRLLMLIKIASFVALVILGSKFVEKQNLLHSNLSKMVLPLPILITSFGFHNMIPSLNAYMKGDTKRVRISIFGGSLFTLVIYIVWQTIALGIIPLEGSNGILESLRVGKEAAQSIGAILQSSKVALFAQMLGFFAILTSFLAQALSVTHFLSDGFNIRRKTKENIGMCLLALIPPLILSFLFPDLFFKALGFAGGICAVILFGVMPVLMVIRGRYILKKQSPYKIKGGLPLLLLVLVFSICIFLFQMTDMLKSNS